MSGGVGGSSVGQTATVTSIGAEAEMLVFTRSQKDRLIHVECQSLLRMEDRKVRSTRKLSLGVALALSLSLSLSFTHVNDNIMVRFWEIMVYGR